MLFYWLLIVTLKFSSIFGDEEHRRVIRQDGSSTCTTPNNSIGTCISLKACPSLLTLLQTQGRDPNTGEFLRKSQCGNTEKNETKVCCPRGSPGTSSTRRDVTTQPTRIVQTVNLTNRVIQTSTSANTNEDYSKCGKSPKKATRIIGGQNATLGDWPWMVALGYRTSTNPGPQFKCGASLLSNRWVVTAAHCVKNIGSLVLTTARVGDLDLTDNGEDNATPIDVPVDEIIPHPDYNSNPIINDIALVRLRNPVTFTKLIRPICILSEAEHRSDGYYANKLPFIIGWGATEWRGPTTNLLQEAQVEIVVNERCVQKYLSQNALIDQRVLCASQNGTDTCQGDSGGPLIVPIGSSYYLAGIVSYGIGCANPNFPGVYTRVAYFADWIRKTARL